MENPALYTSSDWTNVYLAILFLYVVLPSLLPALITLIVVRLKVKKPVRLFVPLALLVTLGLVGSWFALNANDNSNSFALAYTIPAIVIDGLVLALAGVVLKSLVLSRKAH
jgi:hypothetical protein